MVTFRTHGALSAHLGRKHGRRIEARFFVHASVCTACGWDQHTRIRCLRHIQRTLGCREVVDGGGLPRLTLELVQRLDIQDAAARLAARKAGRSEFTGPPAVFVGPQLGAG